MRQRAQMAQFQAQEAREMQQLNREASLQSSYSQQAAAYQSQQGQMIGQAVGSLATLGVGGLTGGEGDILKNLAKNFPTS